MICDDIHCSKPARYAYKACEEHDPKKELRDENARLTHALKGALDDHLKRCHECDAPAGWHEVGTNGRDKFWCEEHVEIPRRAISKGACRYQPQRIRYAAWMKDALEALGFQIVDPTAPLHGSAPIEGNNRTKGNPST